MAVFDVVNLSGLLDEVKCFELVRQHRWLDGVCCHACDSASVIRNAMRHQYGNESSLRNSKRATEVISMAWEYALSLCAKADAGPDGTQE
jgi:hypothetical protein